MALLAHWGIRLVGHRGFGGGRGVMLLDSLRLMAHQETRWVREMRVHYTIGYRGGGGGLLATDSITYLGKQMECWTSARTKSSTEQVFLCGGPRHTILEIYCDGLTLFVTFTAVALCQATLQTIYSIFDCCCRNAGGSTPE